MVSTEVVRVKVPPTSARIAKENSCTFLSHRLWGVLWESLETLGSLEGPGWEGGFASCQSLLTPDVLS